jgi:hypothetical protein
VGSGLSPQDTADQLGLTVGTIRCELKAIFAKVGVSRQSELASTVTRLALLVPNCGDDQGSCINSVYLDEKFLGGPEVSSFLGQAGPRSRNLSEIGSKHRIENLTRSAG